MSSDDNTIKITLDATDARAARREIKARWPRFDISYRGYNKDDYAVLMSLVRKTGDNAAVATARREGGKAVKFIAEVPKTAL